MPRADHIYKSNQQPFQADGWAVFMLVVVKLAVTYGTVLCRQPVVVIVLSFPLAQPS